MTIPVIIIQSLIWTLVKCSGEGNIRLLEEEVLAAMKSCVLPNSSKENNANQRQRRSDDYTRIDANDGNTGQNQYSHERRNSSDMRDKIHILNATDYDYGGYGNGGNGEKYVSSAPRPAAGGVYKKTQANQNRTRRSEPLLKQENDQCLSQCIFANLQVLDSRGIPREAEFWNKVQPSVTSQQSRVALRDQTRACFQELQSEAEDNGCSYSNKLERCLMLRFADRKANGTQNGNNQKI